MKQIVAGRDVRIPTDIHIWCYVGMRKDFKRVYEDCDTLEKLAVKMEACIAQTERLPPGYDKVVPLPPRLTM